MAFPRMLWLAALVVALDVALIVAVLMAPGSQLPSLLFHVGTLVGALGGMEALHWVATRSPWRWEGLPADEPDAATLACRMRQVPWSDLNWLRSAVLRLLSGATVAFTACLAIVFLPGPEGPLVVPWLMVLIQLTRLAPAGLSAVVVAPLVLLAGDRPATARDRLHAALAGGLSLAVLAFLYVRADQPPIGPFLLSLALVSLNPAGHAYGLLIGGVAWWKLCWVSRYMSRR